MTITLVYIHVPGDAPHVAQAKAFITSYQRFQPIAEHQVVVVFQGKPADKDIKLMFLKAFPGCEFFLHDDSGHDIGGYIAVAKDMVKRGAKVDAILCCGGSTFFQSHGWLARLAVAWGKHGSGMYGTVGTYEVAPHLCTTGFLCPPELLAAYPIKVVTRRQRYDFEHGPNAFWKITLAGGYPVKLVTWDEILDWQQWRTPRNIFRRGDQSNCLIYWHHHMKYATASPVTKAIMERHTDTLQDPLWVKLRLGVVLSERDRLRREKMSEERFLKAHKFV